MKSSLRVNARSVIPSALAHGPSQSLIFTHFFTHTPLLDLINYISFVALETEVRECRERKLRDLTMERMRRWEPQKKEARKKDSRKKVWGGREESAVVRLASGDINNDKAAGPDALPWTAGEEDKHMFTKADTSNPPPYPSQGRNICRYTATS